HRGFVELNIAATVCGAVLLLLARHAHSGSWRRLVRILEWVVLLQAQILLVSAFHRVLLYELAYGFTRLRLYVQVYAAVAFVGLGLWGLELRDWRQPERLLRHALLVATAAALVLVYGNSDAWIVRADLQRGVLCARLDVPYLAGLGPDAVPALVDA